MAIPATGRARGTPASISDSDAPHTVAIEDEPFDSVISDTTLIVYGKSALSGINGRIERQASLPCPTSRLPVKPNLPASPTEYGGKL